VSGNIRSDPLSIPVRPLILFISRRFFFFGGGGLRHLLCAWRLEACFPFKWLKECLGSWITNLRHLVLSICWWNCSLPSRWQLWNFRWSKPALHGCFQRIHDVEEWPFNFNFNFTAWFLIPQSSVLTRGLLFTLIHLSVQSASVIIFICSLFHDAFSITQTIYSVEWNDERWMVIWKERGSKRSWPNF
jgi:hypothetical protein